MSVSQFIMNTLTTYLWLLLDTIFHIVDTFNNQHKRLKFTVEYEENFLIYLSLTKTITKTSQENNNVIYKINCNDCDVSYVRQNEKTTLN